MRESSSLKFIPEDDCYKNTKQDHVPVSQILEEIDDLGNSNLHNAIMNNNCDYARVILQQLPHQINLLNGDDQSALHLAAMYGRDGIIPLLVDAGAVLTTCDVYNKSASYYAVVFGYFNALSELIIAHNARCIPFDMTNLLHAAVANGRQEILMMLIQRCPPNDIPLTLLHTVAAKDTNNVSLSMLELLLEHLSAKINVEDKKGRSPLAYAILNARYEIVPILLRQGANINFVNRKKFHALHYAALSGSTVMLDLVYEALGENGIDKIYTPAYGNTFAIDLAVECGSVEAVHWFLRKMEACGQAPAPTHALKNAVKCGHIDIFNLLLQFRINNEHVYVIPCYELNASNFLHLAAEHGQTNILSALLNRISDMSVLNFRDGRGLTPLQYACRCGSVGAVRELLEKGADASLLTQDDRDAIACNKKCILELLDR